MSHTNARGRLVGIRRIAVGLAAASAFVMAGAQEAPEPEEPSATTRAVEELSAAYDRLADMLGEGSDQAVESVQGDIENLGDWEYRILVLPDESPETLETELNALGNERWEVFWIEPTRDGKRIYLKRQSVSYLSRVPLSTLLRLLATGGQ